MGSKTNALEQSIIEAVLKNTSFAGGANNYVALFTAMPGETGGGTEVSGGGYARQAISAATGWSAGGQVGDAYEVHNANDVTFPTATASWGTIVGWALMSAETGGTMRYYGWLADAAYTFTALAADDTFTAPGHGLANNDPVGFIGPNLPGGISAGTTYYARDVSGVTFKVSTTQGGSAVDLTSNGSGTAYRLQPKTVGVNDQFRFLAGALKISEA